MIFVRSSSNNALFGEDKEDRIIDIEDDENDFPLVEETKSSRSNSDIIIICVLSCVIGALTCFVIILLVNNKKKNEIGDVNENK